MSDTEIRLLSRRLRPGCGGDTTGILHPSGAAPARRAGASTDPGATFGRGHNRRRSGQPRRQGVSNTNTGHRTTQAATISHCVRVETLPMAECPIAQPGSFLRPVQLMISWWRPCSGADELPADRPSPKSTASVPPERPPRPRCRIWLRQLWPELRRRSCIVPGALTTLPAAGPGRYPAEICAGWGAGSFCNAFAADLLS